jgi:hypothetical protein
MNKKGSSWPPRYFTVQAALSRQQPWPSVQKPELLALCFLSIRSQIALRRSYASERSLASAMRWSTLYSASPRVTVIRCLPDMVALLDACITLPHSDALRKKKWNTARTIGALGRLSRRSAKACSSAFPMLNTGAKKVRCGTSRFARPRFPGFDVVMHWAGRRADGWLWLLRRSPSSGMVGWPVCPCDRSVRR